MPICSHRHLPNRLRSVMTTRSIETVHLPTANMGNRRTLTVIRYGQRNNAKKAYLQAGLHADEAPGFLVMHHLRQLLDQADAHDAIKGEVVLVPVANPIGVGQWRDDHLQGRFDFYNSINFNRQHFDLTQQVARRIENHLSASREQNTTLIRNALAEAIELISPQDEAEFLKQRLLSLAYDADIVLDLHCDNEALLHVYLGTALWPEGEDLSAQMEAQVTLLAEDSGVTPFDEACSRLWWKLAERFPRYPIAAASLAATVELRGRADVDHERAADDARNLFVFLQRRDLIDGQAPALPELPHAPTPLTGMGRIIAQAPGVVVFHKTLGETVRKGDLVAEVVDPLADTPEASCYPHASPTDGIFFARISDRYARPGRILAKVAGATPLRGEGENLLTM